ncbi:hypothetical protein D9M71_752200 [compost metagenome]
MDHHAVLDVGIGTDDDRLHVAAFIYLVGANNRIGADEDVVMDNHLATDDRGFIHVGGLGNHRQMAGRVFADHGVCSR